MSRQVRDENVKQSGEVLEVAGGSHQKNGYDAHQFRATWRTTQGGLTSPTLFNMAVHRVVWNWLAMKMEDDVVTHDGLGHAVGQNLELFYVENGLLGSRDPKWLQGYLNVLIGLFRQIGLTANVAK